MEITDPIHFGLQVVRLGLVSQAEYNEALEDARTESGKQQPDLIFITRALERRGLLTNFQTSKVLKGDNDGFFLGGYRIRYKIKSGSFGRVFRADDMRAGRVVAIKVLRRRWSEDQQRIDLFIREGRMGLTLKHPNIVEVLAINQDPATRQYYIIMEFVEGGDLREILQRRGTLTVDESMRMLQDMADGLAYAFSRGLTHRDIKLTNILISSTGEAKLVDFGLAQMFAAISREEEHVDRTVDYAGLERATNVKQGDVRSDIFFLGCVFFEMLTGRPPLVMTKDRHQRGQARRFEEVQTLRPGEIQAPPVVYTLCETMLAFDPKRRYQTPSQLLDAVKAARRDLHLPASASAPASSPGAAPARAGRPAGKSIFLAESDQRLQDKLREELKEMGFRVFLASDPARALDRFRQQPYDAIIVDAGTVGEDGVIVFDSLLQEASDRRLPLSGILVLSEDQADWASRITPRKNAAVLVRPVGMKQIRRKLLELGNGK